MEFNHSEELIVPDLTDILTIGGQALELPVGPSTARPPGVVLGGLRFNSTLDELETYKSTGWTPVSAPTSVTTTQLSISDIGVQRAASTAAAVALSFNRIFVGSLD